jgi:hypothetical protein
VDQADNVVGIVTLDDLLMLLGEELADLSQGVSGALFRKPEPAGEEESPMPLAWIMSYL